jgi:hypothetical protein
MPVRVMWRVRWQSSRRDAVASGSRVIIMPHWKPGRATGTESDGVMVMLRGSAAPGAPSLRWHGHRQCAPVSESRSPGAVHGVHPPGRPRASACRASGHHWHY